MRRILQFISIVSLIGTLAPSMLYCAGMMASLDRVQWIMNLSMIVWFVVTPFWMERKG